MKTPLTYFGGKQKLAGTIVPLIPKHNLYCEPFVGGGAIFFSKEPSNIEVVNDIDGNLINFYKVLKNDFGKLRKEIQASLYSRKDHQSAKIVLGYPALFSEVKRAWATWTLLHQGYASIIDGPWGYDRKNNTSVKRFHRKKIFFTKEYAERLEKVQIECRDAVEVIKSRDSKDSFFYCDPPYYNSCQKYVINYTEDDFEKLLDTLSKIKGKFLLSSYPSELLTKYIKKYKWHSMKVDKALCLASNPNVKKQRKTEVFTANYKM